MDDQVEKPVAEHRQTDDHRAAEIFLEYPINTPANKSPYNAHYEAMRVGIMYKFKRRDFRKAWTNPDLLDVQQQQERPENVDELDGDKQREQRYPGGNFLHPER
ncbi:hypothetical protein GCM10010967_26450 [Dyadobacter beijingensis]|uniref:Uncharacterized protein n=1 Tax=Dyadobacter beijingensis TaxID=365489 RepID=A0ABQ2HWJ2_9BACT|nr:hypothetical protein GCM10010967_26450 [Dyadobacter beijingensis]